MAKRKSAFEKAWAKEKGANAKNKFLARRYWRLSLDIEDNDTEKKLMDNE